MNLIQSQARHAPVCLVHDGITVGVDDLTSLHPIVLELKLVLSASSALLTLLPLHLPLDRKKRRRPSSFLTHKQLCACIVH